MRCMWWRDINFMFFACNNSILLRLRLTRLTFLLNQAFFVLACGNESEFMLLFFMQYSLKKWKCILHAVNVTKRQIYLLHVELHFTINWCNTYLANKLEHECKLNVKFGNWTCIVQNADDQVHIDTGPALLLGVCICELYHIERLRNLQSNRIESKTKHQQPFSTEATKV